MPAPAIITEVVKAHPTFAEVRRRNELAHATWLILDVRLDLDAFRELGGDNGQKVLFYCLPVRLYRGEGNAPRTYGVLVPVRVYLNVRHSLEQFLEYVGQGLGVQTAMQGAYEHS